MTATEGPFPYDVFLSHSSLDRRVVGNLAKSLQAAGLTIWLDTKRIGVGHSIYQAIEIGLTMSRKIVLCMSPAAMQSQWVSMERNSVLSLDPAGGAGRVIPILLKPTELPVTLRSLRYIDYQQGKRPAGLAEIVEACRATSALMRPPSMVRIPPGTFTMGLPHSSGVDKYADGPQHDCTIRYWFELGTYQVTVEEFNLFLKATKRRALESDADHPQQPGHPVTFVSWDDAQSYIAWLNSKLVHSAQPEPYRLPSEAEWEYACCANAPVSTVGSSPAVSSGVANVGGPMGIGTGERGYQRTTQVGTYSANRFGLFDMLGNVHEWVKDCANESYAGAPADGSAWTTGDCTRHIVRGGSWKTQPRDVGPSYRIALDTGNQTHDVGFRLARTIS